MNETYKTKLICLTFNLLNGIRERGKLGRALKLCYKNMDSTIRYGFTNLKRK